MDASVIIKRLRSNNQTGDTVWIVTPHGRDTISFLTYTFLLPRDYHLSVASMKFNRIVNLLVVSSSEKNSGMILPP
jgi:hypothetical protein